MSQTLPEGAFILPADLARIDAALEQLKTTSNAHASVNVQVNLHVHYEYPKHVTIKDAEGKDSTLVVNNEEEELAALATNVTTETASTPEPIPQT